MAAMTASFIASPTLNSKSTSASIMEDSSNANKTIDDFLLSRLKQHPDAPLLAYPATARGTNDYVDYTAKDLDRFADEAARKYAGMGLVPENPNVSEAEVVAILAPSNLDYIATVFALTRMGFAILFFSNRLATEAFVNLLKRTKCTKLVVGTANTKAAELIQADYPIRCFPILNKASYDIPTPSGPRFPSASPPNVSSRIAFIIHSSGSTGLPKPIFQTHRACLTNYAGGNPYRAFVTLPLYHNHGISTLFRGFQSFNRVAIWNSNLPLTGSSLIEAMETVNPESFHSVPYALKLLAEAERGIKCLKRCKLVMFGGSSCPDELGDKLVDAGVYLVGHYGATEMGQLMTSFRPAEDKSWNYMRPLASAKPYLRFIERAPNVFECKVLDGLPSKVLSNCDDPPNSFNTRDTFVPHPTIQDAWKYLGRLDDRITLLNGEKVLPIPYEHLIRQHELVHEAIVFGIGRTVPGLIVIPSEKASGMEKQEILEALLPTIKDANSRSEAFGSIAPEMVEVLDVYARYPRTDKGTAIRAAFYKQFADLIDSIYQRFESADEVRNGECMTLGLAEMEEYLLNLFRASTGDQNFTSFSDFFEAGIDSLQAITIRARIMREVDLGSNTLGQNIVFEYSNVKALARRLIALRNGELSEQDELAIMQELIEKYSTFPKWTPGSRSVDGEIVILTGATGSLGAHVLSQLVTIPTVKEIYCLVRATSPTSAEQRVRATLRSRKLGIRDSHFSKITCLPADLSRSTLGLSGIVLEDLKNSLTTVIHSAWAVNFNLGVRSFESYHIRGTHNLLKFCLNVQTEKPARMFFCSSISTAAGTPLPATIPEAHIDNLSHAQNMGYARSKLVTEHIIRAAAQKTGMEARVLRVGQIMGDTAHGIWNTTEAIPLMIRSANSIGVLPALDENLSWIPVDVCARAVLELTKLIPGSDDSDPASQHTDPEMVYHVINTNTFHWTRDLLPALKASSPSFEVLPQREWIKRLKEGDQDPEKNPTIKLLGFFEDKYDNDKPGRAGLDFRTARTGNVSEAVRSGYDVVGSGLIGKVLEYWNGVW
ncbi:acetyl-CoA synthetase-like protein [Zopfia rhizophila CBS 207.26]|uniref:Acetyl-CoA synthetase-like protein n=1 Tax=Zopfia rhizophila CBS 207.26 TaxID=1314779 RepID=A0A6A6EXX1_9PEZI|nr:acetyl-CoA synthetase-like protein [Zopfia rhizophila CBS 207.26]